jgi:hypothetical protein
MFRADFNGIMVPFTKEVKITAEETWTIADLKERIQQHTDLPPNSVIEYIAFKGKTLPEKDFIFSVGLQSDTVLQAKAVELPPSVWCSFCMDPTCFPWCPVHAPMCFAGDTPVRMADGSCEPLAKVKVGDRVQSFDVASGNEISGTVVEAWRSAHAMSGWRSSVFRHDSTGATQTFVHTPQHEWLTTITDVASDADESSDDADASGQDGRLRLGWANMETPEEFDMRMNAAQNSNNSNNSKCTKWSRALQPGDLVVGCDGESWTLVKSSALPSAQKHVTYNLVVEGYGSSANLFSVGSAGGLFVMGKPGGLNPLTHQGQCCQNRNM